MTARPALPLLAMTALSLLWLHCVHKLAGHEWFANYGLVAAALLVLVMGSRRPGGGRRRMLCTAAVVMPVFTALEWLEGELAAGHSISWPVLADHGWPILASLLLVLAVAMLLESVRLLELVREFTRRP